MTNMHIPADSFSVNRPVVDEFLASEFMDLADTPREIMSFQFNAARAFTEFNEFTFDLPLDVELAILEMALTDLGTQAIGEIENVAEGDSIDAEDYYGTIFKLDEFIERTVKAEDAEMFIAAILLETAYIDALADPEDKAEELEKNRDALLIEGVAFGISPMLLEFLTAHVSQALARASINQSSLAQIEEDIIRV